ncbi:TetR/AcrR family transcriptional regulator [Sinomonas sp. R1AF57]|uniref:TetR/AcrR family transcriptional regulator n=1 Tax=Sinomonas sp. R1AF57 TaxID=2020377 RepID=UPI000B60E669|nr:TetR/AcrR family transcriptional regulator [Sinomonas sp. R1AF57]ASN53271.1 TetR family transcriptional regulator [Sinomonas sp. R1AF57]
MVREKSEDARERILAACSRCIARTGVRGLRIQEVAKEAGVSTGLLYYHFGDRDGLLRAALDFVNASAAARAEDASIRSPQARLRALLHSEFGDEDGVREGSTAWNELRASAVFDSAQAEAITASTRSWQESVALLVAEARDAHDAGQPPRAQDVSVAPGSPDEAALVLTALVEGLSGRWLTGQLDVVAARKAVDVALAALGLFRGADVSRP